MAGHSHWANIAHKKAAIDKKRGKIFSMLARKIIAAAKSGGGDPSTNNRLKDTIAAARAANMSNDQISRAIKRATGAAADAENYEELLYEGYAVGGAAVLIEALTENRNRTGGDVRSILSKRGGNLGGTGSVAWQFGRKSVVQVPSEGVEEDDLMMAVLEADAEEIEDLGDVFEVHAPADKLQELCAAIEGAGWKTTSAEITYVPNDYLPVDEDTARKVVGLLEALEDNEDVQKVHTNAEFPEGFEG